MKEILREARKKRNLSQQKVAELMHTCTRTIWELENEKNPDAFKIKRLSEIYNRPDLTQIYCKKLCPIGRDYSFEILDNVNLDLPTILLKLRSEMKEGEIALNNLLEASINNDFEDDLETFEKNVHELLDIEHNIEVLKIKLHKWLEVKKVIKDHNDKCIERNYTKKEKTPARTDVKQ